MKLRGRKKFKMATEEETRVNISGYLVNYYILDLTKFGALLFNLFLKS